MSAKNNSKRYDLLAIRAREAEKRGGDSILFTLGDEAFETPAPGFFSDALKKAARDDNDDEYMRLALGEDLQRFYDAGGSSDLLGMLYYEYASDQGASLGESKA